MKTTFRRSRMLVAGLLFGAVSVVAPEAQAQAGGLTVRGRVLHNPMMNDCLQESCPLAADFTRDQDWVPTPAAVNVVVRGTDIVAKTDRQGNYQITVPSPDSELVFLYVGFDRAAVPVQGRSTVDVRLTPTPIPVIERLLGLIMPQLETGVYPNLDQLAAEGRTNRETARDMVWLVIGNRVMQREYPGEFYPDYRFADPR